VHTRVSKPRLWSLTMVGFYLAIFQDRQIKDLTNQHHAVYHKKFYITSKPSLVPNDHTCIFSVWERQ